MRTMDHELSHEEATQVLGQDPANLFSLSNIYSHNPEVRGLITGARICVIMDHKTNRTKAWLNGTAEQIAETRTKLNQRISPLVQ